MTISCIKVNYFFSSLLEFHGYRGEALASLRQICSIVQITSRPQNSNETNIGTFVRGKRKLVEKSLRERPTHGTTTLINEFFYNMPVRRKAFNGVLELENVKDVLSAIGKR